MASVKGLSFVFSIVRCFNCVVSVCVLLQLKEKFKTLLDGHINWDLEP